MPDTESDHHRGLAVAAVVRLDLVAPPAAPATATATARDVYEDDGFTFSAVADSIPPLEDADGAFPDARIGSPVYPVFGRPRWSPPEEQEQQQDDDEEDTAAAGMATVRRVPFERLLLEEQWIDCAPSASASGQQQQPADDADAELDGVPAETYCCLWSTGVPPAARVGSSRRASPARCQKSGSTGSSVLRWWRRRVVVEPSHSDGKDEFAFVGTSYDRIGAAGEQGWMNRGSAARGGGKSSSTAVLSCKQDLVELVVSAVTCRRSCYLI